jgi:3-oxoacyl-[acyl-carrier-protein] synthase-1
LEARSPEPCNPFSVNRRGITIGEGGAVFLMTPEPGGIALRGVGESSDAHHLSAPDPEGAGALAAMRLALDDAGLGAGDIGYVNLHGTATALNDAMESKAVHSLFGGQLPCSSTKAMTGHTLGAAGAIEAALVWLILSSDWNPERRVPVHIWDELPDPALPALALATAEHRLEKPAVLSNSFAFGGSNCALVLAS